jgi:hypothetical protein
MPSFNSAAKIQLFLEISKQIDKNLRLLQFYAFFRTIVDISLYLCAEFLPSSSYKDGLKGPDMGGLGTQKSLNVSAIWILYLMKTNHLFAAFTEAVSPSFVFA